MATGIEHRFSILLLVVALVASQGIASVSVWTDSETGIEWKYEDCGSSVRIVGDSHESAITNTVSGDLVIPSLIQGKPVSDIGSYAFSGCSGLTSVKFPSGLWSIGEWAFSGCSGLSSVEVPASVYVHNYAFVGCEGLTSFVIPEHGVGNYALSGCSRLTSVTFSPGVTSIGYGAFRGCRSLTSVTIPYGVTEIRDDTFSGCTSLTTVTIPSSVRTIGSAAFGDCTALMSLEIPGSVTQISSSAILGTRLTSFVVDDGSNSFCSENGLLLSKNKKSLLSGLLAM